MLFSSQELSKRGRFDKSIDVLGQFRHINIKIKKEDPHSDEHGSLIYQLFKQLCVADDREIFSLQRSTADQTAVDVLL